MAPAKKKGKKKKRLPLTPLQRIGLSQLKLVGIIVSPTGNKALVEEPSGKGYIISKGTYVGTNFGRVKKVLNDRVIVEEEVEDFSSGEMKPQTTELRLQKRPGHV
jgi:type IV pilus assembly protein PilP